MRYDAKTHAHATEPESVASGEFEAGQFHWAHQYDYSPAEYERQRRRYLWNYRALLDLPRTAKVLEIGCGGGFFLHFLQKAGYTCTGIDLDPAAIQACRQHVSDRVFCIDAETFLRESSEKFDLIVSNHVIEHIPRSRALSMLRATAARLSAGGEVCIATPNAMSPWAGFHLYNDPTHLRLYTPQTLEELLLDAGFKRISIRGEGPAPYDALTLTRYLLWKLRRRWLYALFAVDVGIGRKKRMQILFEQGLIAHGYRKD